MIAYDNIDKIKKLAYELNGKKFVGFIIDNKEKLQDYSSVCSLMFNLGDLEEITLLIDKKDDFLFYYSASLFDFDIDDFIDEDNDKNEIIKKDIFDESYIYSPSTTKDYINKKTIILLIEDEELSNLSKMFENLTKKKQMEKVIK